MKKKRLSGILLGFALMLGMMMALGQVAYAADVEPTSYDLWVGGIQVTDANKDDVFKDAETSCEGTVSFDPESCTLTLKDATIDDERTTKVLEEDFSANIFATGLDLTIKLEGNNVIKSHFTYADDGIYIEKNEKTAITGEGSLEVYGKTHAICMDEADCEISSGQITAKSTNLSSIFVWKDLTITGGQITTRSDSDDGIFTGNGVRMSGGTLHAMGSESGICAIEAVTIEDGTVTATGLSFGIHTYDDTVVSGGKVIASGTREGILSDGNVKIEDGEVEACATGSDGIGIFADVDITVDGGDVTATAKDEDSDSGMEANNKVTINDGTVTASGAMNGILSYGGGDITIKDGIVKAEGGEDGIFSAKAKVIISGGDVTAVGNDGCGVTSAEVTIGEDVDSVVAAGTERAFADFDEDKEEYIDNTVKNAIAGAGWNDTEGIGSKKSIGINTEGAPLAYKKVQFPTSNDGFLWVGGVEVTGSGPVTGEGITGKVYYDEMSNILTLENATITGLNNVVDPTIERYDKILTKDSNIYYKGWPGDELTIEVIGLNEVGELGDREAPKTQIAIDANENVTIAGPGSLNLRGWQSGIWAEKNLRIEDTTMSAYAKHWNAAIFADKTLVVDNSTLFADSEGYEAIRTTKSMLINDSTVMATSVDDDVLGSYDGDISIVNSYVDATANWSEKEPYDFHAIDAYKGKIRISDSFVNAVCKEEGQPAMKSGRSISIGAAEIASPKNGKMDIFDGGYVIVDENDIPVSQVVVRPFKDPSTMAAIGKVVTLKSGAKKLKKAKKIASKKAYTILRPNGTVTFKKVKADKASGKFKVDTKTGDITVKKGTKNGTYKLTVTVMDSGDEGHYGGATDVVVKIKIKK